MKFKTITSAAGVTIALGVIVATAPSQPSMATASHPALTRCSVQLHAISTVADEAGLQIGDTRLPPAVNGNPRSLARQLRRAGLPELGKAALGIHNAASAKDFNVALEATALADTTRPGGHNCRIR